MCCNPGTAWEASISRSEAMECPGPACCLGGARPSSQSKRRKNAPTDSNNEDGEAALQSAWGLLGMPAAYEPASRQERKDMANSRHRKRGEKTKRQRLERGWLALERAKQRLSAQTTGTDTRPVPRELSGPSEPWQVRAVTTPMRTPAYRDTHTQISS